jgi:NADH-quinone oxidoreductase subunit M
MSTGFHEWALSLVVFIPTVGAILVGLIPRRSEGLIKFVTLLSTLGAFGVGIGVLADYELHASGVQYEVDKKWIDVINARFHMGVDGLSLALLLMTLFVSVLCVIYSWNHFPEPHNPKAFLLLLLILETGMLGSFVALDLILFFVFFEVVLLPMYFMIGIWGGEQREYAAIKFFLFTLFGSAFMLIAFLAIYFNSHPVTIGATHYPHTFDMLQLTQQAGSGVFGRGFQNVAFIGLFLGFAIKVPMFPFHTWLPDAHTQAPTVGSVLLAAVMLKLGTYGFVRIALPILPRAAHDWAPFIGLLAVIGIIYGALCCLAQSDMKRLIAFSSVAHMGFVMLGISTLTPVGINAAIFGMVAHGFITGMLFFLSGSVHERYHTREIDELGGMQLQIPIFGWILAFCCFASLGLPALAGFPGEFMSMLAAYNPARDLNTQVFRIFMVVAAVGTVLAAGYLLWMMQRVNLGRVRERFAGSHIHDVHVAEMIAWTPLLLMIVAVGVYPGLIYNITNPTVSRIFGG